MNIDDYRQGYKDGVKASKTPGKDLVDAMFDMINTPSYRKGWKDGYNGREFDPGELGLFDTDDADDEGDGADEDADAIEERSARSSRGSYSCDSYSGDSSSSPETSDQKAFRIVIAIFLFLLDFGIAVYVVTHPQPFPHNRMEIPDISANPIILLYFIFLLIVFPGGLLFWPGLVLSGALDKKDEKK